MDKHYIMEIIPDMEANSNCAESDGDGRLASVFIEEATRVIYGRFLKSQNFLSIMMSKTQRLVVGDDKNLPSVKDEERSTTIYKMMMMMTSARPWYETSNFAHIHIFVCLFFSAIFRTAKFQRIHVNVWPYKIKDISSPVKRLAKTHSESSPPEVIAGCISPCSIANTCCCLRSSYHLRIKFKTETQKLHVEMAKRHKKRAIRLRNEFFCFSRACYQSRKLKARRRRSTSNLLMQPMMLYKLTTFAPSLAERWVSFMEVQVTKRVHWTVDKESGVAFLVAANKQTTRWFLVVDCAPYNENCVMFEIGLITSVVPLDNCLLWAFGEGKNVS